MIDNTWFKNNTFFPVKSWVSPMRSGLRRCSHSPARSHYCPTRPVWAALCPAWPGSRLLRPPGRHPLLGRDHVDAGLSADAGSTWPAPPSLAPPPRGPASQPPGSRVTETRHGPRHVECWPVAVVVPRSEHTPRHQRHLYHSATGGIIPSHLPGHWPHLTTPHLPAQNRFLIIVFLYIYMQTSI